MVERRTLTAAPPVTTGADAAAALAVEGSLKRLVRAAMKTDTTPHGLKVAEEGEGTAYAMPDGTLLVLDGMKAAQWNTEIAGARQAVEDARLVVEETQSSLDATEQRLDTTAQELLQVQSDINAAAATAASKTTTTWAPNSPGSVGAVGATVGDTWHWTDGATGPVLLSYEWDGTTWKTRQLSSTTIRYLDVSKLTAGTAELQTLTAQKIAAGVGQFVKVQAANVEVTGELSARVVEAMDINAKRLVVTEDAILNQVTAIEGIVTPTLVANRINLADLGGDLMQEAALTVVGPTGTVQLSGSGYQAWDAQNNLTVRLSGANNLITGDLQTAASGTRALISTRANTSAIDFFVGNAADHGGVWYDGGALKTLTIGVMPDGGFNANTSASLRFVLDQKLLQVNAIMGTSNRQQHGYYTWPAPGIPANGSSAEVTIPFRETMSDAGQLYIHFQPEAPSGARMTVTQTFTSSTEIRFILHNHSNFATGRMWLWWTAITRSRWWA